MLARLIFVGTICLLLTSLALGDRAMPAKASCSGKILNNEGARACFLAGTASDQGDQDDDSLLDGVNATMLIKSKNKKKSHYQCIDCLLSIPGISHWGCSIVALRTWCEISTQQEIEASGPLSSRIALSNNKTSPEGHAKNMKMFEKTNAKLLAKAEKQTNKDLVEVMKEFEALFKKHPKLRKKAIVEMKEVVAAEKKKKSFSFINKIGVEVDSKLNVTDSDEISEVKKHLSEKLMKGYFHDYRRRLRGDKK
jgi:hypothetical protein